MLLLKVLKIVKIMAGATIILICAPDLIFLKAKADQDPEL
jgi:hypothetical protein